MKLQHPGKDGQIPVFKLAGHGIGFVPSPEPVCRAAKLELCSVTNGSLVARNWLRSVRKGSLSRAKLALCSVTNDSQVVVKLGSFRQEMAPRLCGIGFVPAGWVEIGFVPSRVGSSRGREWLRPEVDGPRPTLDTTRRPVLRLVHGSTIVRHPSQVYSRKSWRDYQSTSRECSKTKGASGPGRMGPLAPWIRSVGLSAESSLGSFSSRRWFGFATGRDDGGLDLEGDVAPQRDESRLGPTGRLEGLAQVGDAAEDLGSFGVLERDAKLGREFRRDLRTSIGGFVPGRSGLDRAKRIFVVAFLASGFGRLEGPARRLQAMSIFKPARSRANRTFSRRAIRASFLFSEMPFTSLGAGATES